MPLLRVQVVSTLELGKQVNTFAFLSDKLIAVGCEEDTNLHVCDVDTEYELVVPAWPGHALS